MTRTKKMLLAGLAAALFSGVAIGDDGYIPEPIPTVTEAQTEAMAGRGDCPDFDATKAQSAEDLKLTCDRHVVSVE